MKKLLPLPQLPNRPTANGSGVSVARSTETSISTSVAMPSRSAVRTLPFPGSGTVSAAAPARSGGRLTGGLGASQSSTSDARTPFLARALTTSHSLIEREAWSKCLLRMKDESMLSASRAALFSASETCRETGGNVWSMPGVTCDGHRDFVGSARLSNSPACSIPARNSSRRAGPFSFCHKPKMRCSMCTSSRLSAIRAASAKARALTEDRERRSKSCCRLRMDEVVFSSGCNSDVASLEARSN